MLKKIGLVLVVVVVGIFIYAEIQPDTFHVQRSISIKAPPDKIFAEIADLHAWKVWSPYVKLDPTMKTSYSGAPAGIGAVYEWQGNNKVGTGRVTITDIDPPNQVSIRLQMFKPLITSSDVAFTLATKNELTKVTWAMSGRNDIFSKVLGLFVNKDQVLGAQFAEGLANLKAQMEK